MKSLKAAPFSAAHHVVKNSALIGLTHCTDFPLLKPLTIDVFQKVITQFEN